MECRTHSEDACQPMKGNLEVEVVSSHGAGTTSGVVDDDPEEREMNVTNSGDKTQPVGKETLVFKKHCFIFRMIDIW